MTLANWLSPPEWLVEETVFDIGKLNVYETLFTVGNGYQGTRGAYEEGVKGDWSATYLAGVFDHHDSTVIDLVNAPNWLPLTIWVEGVRLNMQSCKVLQHRRVLDMRAGFLYRSTRFEDSRGRTTQYESLRYASVSNQHSCAIRVLLTPENYSGAVVVESSVDGTRYNLDRLPQYAGEQVLHPEVKWEKWAKSKHLEFVTATAQNLDGYLEMKTLDTGHRLGYATSLDSPDTDATARHRLDYEKVSEVLEIEVRQGTTYTFDKLVAIYTSRDVVQDGIRGACFDALRHERSRTFETRLGEHKEVWRQKWSASDCVIDGDPQAAHALRFNIYHLLIAATAKDYKVNIGAKSLSGEGYKGHVFWDTEIFMLPFFIYTQPETAKALLRYRYHTMSGALDNARANGFSGTQYPWEAADSGIETTPKWTADGANRIWTGEEEIHITADVAYGIVTYLVATDDLEFFFEYGAEILFNTARFWVSRLEYNQTQDRHELTRVIGPDEYHEHVNNNAFTNWMTQWNLRKAVDLGRWLEDNHAEEYLRISAKMQLGGEEIARWEQLAAKIFIPFDRKQGLVEQFEGYFQCKEIPITEWDQNEMPVYPAGYDHFNAGETTLLKQPDVVMLMYVLPDELEDDIKRANYAYYEQHTMHKSSLSPSIHSIIGIEVGDTEKAEQYFLRSALVDLMDNQGNTEWGIHAASAGGTWMSAVFGFGGFRVRHEKMTFKPWLPDSWKELRFKLKWRGDTLSVTIRAQEAIFHLDAAEARTEDIVVCGQACLVQSGMDVTVPIVRPHI